MGSLGFWEIVALAVLALFIFGPERLPGMARSAGKTIAALRREANKTLTELKESAGLDEDFEQLTSEARQLRNSLTDVRRTATSALMGPVDEARAEVSQLKGEVEGRHDKPQSGPGMAALTPTAGGAVPGDAPYDPDAT